MEKTSTFIKISLLLAIAVSSLFVASCTDNVFPAQQSELRPTMIDPWTAIDQTPYAQIGAEAASSLKAGFLKTKSHMEMNGGNTFAKVVWNAGDSFVMYAWDPAATPDPHYWSADYTTSDNGDVVDFTTSHSVGTCTPQHSLHAPATDQIITGHDGESFFGLNLPANQTAVADKVNDNYLYSYARSVNQGDNLTFKNILALVQFKLSGTIVSSVKQITLTAANPIAGDFVIIPTSEGVPSVTISKEFTGHQTHVTTITLSGDFVAGKSYYFAVLPGNQSGFSLVFANAGGTASTTKIATKTVNFEQGKIADLGTIDLGSSFTDDPANPNMDAIKFVSATTVSPVKPVTIAVIPDGFTKAEMNKYEMLAKSAINTLFSVEPFQSYKEYFNVYILKVASNESGARITDGNSAEQNRDCYFESAWAASSYDDMNANASKIQTFVTDNCPDIINNIHTFQEVPVLVIINDSRYGGRCHSSYDGSGYGLVPYTYNGSKITWSYPANEAYNDTEINHNPAYKAVPAEKIAELGKNVGNWLNTMVHEFGGHCFGRLADEYWSGTLVNTGTDGPIEGYRWDSQYDGVPFGLNVSATHDNPGYDNPGGDAKYIKQGWQHLLDNKATLVASDAHYKRIGVYQGGGTFMLNRWRSEQISCMIDNRFYFSTFQRELIVKRIMSLAGKDFNETEFWAKDKTADPVRDVISSSVMGEDPVVPRPVPLLPPPVFHTDW